MAYSNIRRNWQLAVNTHEKEVEWTKKEVKVGCFQVRRETEVKQKRATEL